MRLLLMRHGDAVTRANTDFERNLSPYGVDQVKSTLNRIRRLICRSIELSLVPMSALSRQLS